MSKWMKTVILLGLLVSTTLAQTPQSVDAADTKLRYEKPAKLWEQEAMPLGNGRLGAIVFGGIANEEIQFNEIKLLTEIYNTELKNEP